MVNKSPNKKTKVVNKSNFYDFDIDEKYLCGYVKGGHQMNPTLHLITCVW